MIKTKIEMVEQELAESITCDFCNKKYSLEYGHTDEMEVQEFMSYTFTGGYSSVFGDGFSGRIDLCQHCFKVLLGQYVQCTDEIND